MARNLSGKKALVTGAAEEFIRSECNELLQRLNIQHLDSSEQNRIEDMIYEQLYEISNLKLKYSEVSDANLALLQEIDEKEKTLLDTISGKCV